MKVSCSWFCAYIVLYCCVNIVNSVDYGEAQQEEKDCNDLLLRVLGAVQKAVEFFALEYRNINLDALLGLRMSQGEYNLSIIKTRNSSFLFSLITVCHIFMQG